MSPTEAARSELRPGGFTLTYRLQKDLKICSELDERKGTMGTAAIVTRGLTKRFGRSERTRESRPRGESG